MNKQSLLSHLIYAGAVYEKGRDMKYVLLRRASTAEVRRHVRNMIEMLDEIMCDKFDGHELDCIHDFLTLKFMEANGLLSAQLNNWLSTASDELYNDNVSNEQRKIDKLMRLMLEDIQAMLNGPLPIVYSNAISSTFKALHNLPKIHMTDELFGIWKKNAESLKGSLILDASMSYLHEKKKRFYLQRCQ